MTARTRDREEFCAINRKEGRPMTMKCFAAAAADPRSWHPMTEEEADYCLEVLPPIYFPGGFAVSEPLRDAGELDIGTGEVYLAVARKDGKPYCRELTRCSMAQEARDLKDGTGVCVP